MSVLTAQPSASPALTLSKAGRPIEAYRSVRTKSESLAAPLGVEDRCVQSMPDTSPTKWHLAHCTWFFETMLLKAFAPNYKPFDKAYATLFNSYYESFGPRHPRPQRGLLTRPSCADIARYRAYVDEHIEDFIAQADETVWQKAAPLLTLGCHHEQQHQELILTDILHAFSLNPIQPVYRPFKRGATKNTAALDWIVCNGGMQRIGHVGPAFAFDNEGPAHHVYVDRFRIASRPVINAEWLAFIEDDGYQRPEFWLSDGWAVVQQEQWNAPLYWSRDDDGQWSRFTLGGLIDLDPAAPVCHVSFYEADAYARWAGKRLPTEQEWETVARTREIGGNFQDNGIFDPQSADHGQFFGDVWEWTQSPYVAYPRFKSAVGAVGEYNGKFMVNQIVLRGGSCATPANHIRPTYRNFFYPNARWQFSGLRLADDL